MVPFVVVGDFIDHSNGTVTDIRTELMFSSLQNCLRLLKTREI